MTVRVRLDDCDMLDCEDGHGMLHADLLEDSVGEDLPDDKNPQ